MIIPQKSRAWPALRAAGSAGVLLMACVLLVLHRSGAASGIRSGISVCLEALIPALFPFVLLSALFSGSAASGLLCRPLGPVMRHLFRLPACAAPALLFGLTAGYPAGAGIAAALYADGRLTKEQTARLLCCCTAPGYAFSVYAGAALPGGAHTGRLLFLASLLPPIWIGITMARFVPKPEAAPEPPAACSGFTESVRRSTAAMVTLCSFVVVFSALLALLKTSGLFGAAVQGLMHLGLGAEESAALCSFLLEVTAGVRESAGLPPVLTAFGLGFAGLCIHLQICALFFKTGFPISKGLYTLLRLAAGILTAGAYLVLNRIFPASTAVMAGAPMSFAPTAGSPAASAALLLLSFFFLLSCRSPSAAEFTFRGWKSDT